MEDIAAPKLRRSKKGLTTAQELSKSNVIPLNQSCQDLITKTMKIDSLRQITLPFLEAFHKLHSITIDTDAPRITWALLRQGALLCELANLKTSGSIPQFHMPPAQIKDDDLCFEETVCRGKQARDNLAAFLTVCQVTHFKTEGELFSITEFMDESNSNNQLRIAISLAFWYLDGLDSALRRKTAASATTTATTTATFSVNSEASATSTMATSPSDPLLKISKRMSIANSMKDVIYHNDGVDDFSNNSNNNNNNNNSCVDEDQKKKQTTTSSATKLLALTSAEKHRLMAQQEFLTTETQYVADLEELQTYAMEVHLSKTLTPSEEVKLFSNLDSIVELQISFQLGMEKMFRGTELCIEAATSCSFATFFVDNLVRMASIYPIFLLNSQNARSFFTSSEGGGGGSKLDRHNRRMNRATTLGAFMIKPMQRMPRYQMLLKEMIKATKAILDERLSASLAEGGGSGGNSQLDLLPLTTAYLHSTFFTLWINERQRIQDYEAISKGLFSSSSGFDGLGVSDGGGKGGKSTNNTNNSKNKLLLFTIQEDCAVFLFEMCIIQTELPGERRITPEMLTFPSITERRRIRMEEIGSADIVNGSIILRGLDERFEDLCIRAPTKELLSWLATIRAIITEIWEKELNGIDKKTKTTTNVLTEELGVEDSERSSRRLSCKVVENILQLKKDDPIIADHPVEIRPSLIETLIACDYSSYIITGGGASGVAGDGSSGSSTNRSEMSLQTLSSPHSISIPDSTEPEKDVWRLKIMTDTKNYLMAIEEPVLQSLDGIRAAVVWKLRSVCNSNGNSCIGDSATKTKTTITPTTTTITVEEAFSRYKKNSILKKRKDAMTISVVDEDGDEVEVMDDSDLLLLLMGRSSDKLVIRVRFYAITMV